MKYNVKLPNFSQMSSNKLAMSGVILATGVSGSLLWNTYQQSRQIAAILEQNAQTTAAVAAIAGQLSTHAATSAALEKRLARLSTRVSKLERNTTKTTQAILRAKNHERVVKKLGGVPKTIIYKTEIKLSLSKSERYCLQKNVYHEAAFESDAGMLAVAQVTGNRVASRHRGDTFCSVIYAPKQFSWTINPVTRNSIPAPTDKNWVRAGAIIKRYEAGERIRGLEKSEFYYARYIKSPRWAKDMQYTHYLGEHLFLNHKS